MSNPAEQPDARITSAGRLMLSLAAGAGLSFLAVLVRYAVLWGQTWEPALYAVNQIWWWDAGGPTSLLVATLRTTLMLTLTVAIFSTVSRGSLVRWWGICAGLTATLPAFWAARLLTDLYLYEPALQPNPSVFCVAGLAAAIMTAVFGLFTFPLLSWATASRDAAESRRTGTRTAWSRRMLRAALLAFTACALLLTWFTSAVLVTTPSISEALLARETSYQDKVASALFEEFGVDLAASRADVTARIAEYAAASGYVIYIVGATDNQDLFAFASPADEVMRGASYPGDDRAREAAELLGTDRDPYASMSLSPVPAQWEFQILGSDPPLPEDIAYQVALRPADDWWMHNMWTAGARFFGTGEIPGWSYPISSLAGPASVLLAIATSFALVFTIGTLGERRTLLEHSLAAEQLRSSIARDAHDRVYNRLTALSTMVESYAAGSSSDAHEELQLVAFDIRGTVTDLQRILGDGASQREDSSVLGSNAGSMSPLALVIADVCESQSTRNSVEVRLTGLDALANIPHNLGWDIECIVDEGLTNAVKHGNATAIEVCFTRAGGQLILTVTDDGTGPPEGWCVDLLPATHRGLRGMQERLDPYRGSLELTRRDDRTELMVTVSCPMPG